MTILDFINSNIMQSSQISEFAKMLDIKSLGKFDYAVDLQLLGIYEMNHRLFAKAQAILPDWQNVVCDLLTEMFPKKKDEIELLRCPSKSRNELMKDKKIKKMLKKYSDTLPLDTKQFIIYHHKKSKTIYFWSIMKLKKYFNDETINEELCIRIHEDDGVYYELMTEILYQLKRGGGSVNKKSVEELLRKIFIDEVETDEKKQMQQIIDRTRKHVGRKMFECLYGDAKPEHFESLLSETIELGISEIRIRNKRNIIY